MQIDREAMTLDVSGHYARPDLFASRKKEISVESVCKSQRKRGRRGGGYFDCQKRKERNDGIELCGQKTDCHRRHKRNRKAVASLVLSNGGSALLVGPPRGKSGRRSRNWVHVARFPDGVWT